eukprot:TRINITY_DN18721_c0_g1_i1.p1 TRINITY_DN18721_c0_g1~~TRINITY_DN18721_c0_g1_i1.p1  ORF type:complete len:527 (+),score=71.99 TRINITY_DN18721_c0_g1_i1:71-1582(+)
MGICHSREPVDPSICEAKISAPTGDKSRAWKGWGCSLAWCGKALGKAADAPAWADLLFSLHDVDSSRLFKHLEQDDTNGLLKLIPGLGMNIARYNIGGTGRHSDNSAEKRSKRTRGWYADVEGFLPDKGAEYDWSRDEEQRQFMTLAVERGVDDVEMFSNAPMWWMTSSKSSFGGYLEKADDFAVYLAEVTAYAQRQWQFPVKSVSPFNEPSAGWWKYPHDQEGCNIPASQQGAVLRRLRMELDDRGLNDVMVVSSDENTYASAKSTLHRLKRDGHTSAVQKVNTHAYDGHEPWKESYRPGARRDMRTLAAEEGLPLWQSEFGSNDADGIKMAQAIMEDLHHLRPVAWCYWQPVEHTCSWGFIEAEFSEQDGAKATKTPHPKYYVFAQFSRFLRPGFELLETSDDRVAAGFCSASSSLVVILLNTSDVTCRTGLDVENCTAVANSCRIVTTYPRQPGRYLVESSGELAAELPDGGIRLHMEVEAYSIATVIVSDVKIREIVTV